MYLEGGFYHQIVNIIAKHFAIVISSLLLMSFPLFALTQVTDVMSEIKKGSDLNAASKYELALSHFKRLEEGSDLKPEEEITVNFEMATAHYYKGQYPLSIERILKSISLAERLNNDSIILNTKRFAGEIYRASDNPEISKKYLEEALELAHDLDDQESEAYCLNRLGVIAFINGNHSMADSLFNASLTLCKQYTFMKVLSMNLNDLGELYFNQGEPEKSLDVYQDALKLPLNLDIDINTLNNMASALLKLNREEEAIDIALKAQRLADEAEILTLAERAVRIIADCYMSKGDFENGIIFYRKYMNYRGRLFNEQKDAQILELEKKYESERKQFLIDQQNSKLALLTANNDFQRKMIMVISVLMVLLFGLIYTYRSKRFAIKSKLLQEAFSQKLLTYQERERHRISRDLHDSIGQSLILIKNKIQLKDQETGDMIATTLEEVRTISKQLHPVLLEKLGITASIERLIEEVDKNTSIFIDSSIDQIDGIFPKEHELHIYRIIQETINNMMKHADAVSASIKVENTDETVRYSIIDHGKGFDLIEDPAQFMSMGMQTLRERTKILNGQLSIDAVVGKGTTIILTIEKATRT